MQSQQLQGQTRKPRHGRFAVVPQPPAPLTVKNLIKHKHCTFIFHQQGCVWAEPPRQTAHRSCCLFFKRSSSLFGFICTSSKSHLNKRPTVSNRRFRDADESPQRPLGRITCPRRPPLLVVSLINLLVNRLYYYVICHGCSCVIWGRILSEQSGVRRAWQVRERVIWNYLCEHPAHIITTLSACQSCLHVNDNPVLCSGHACTTRAPLPRFVARYAFAR